jgi:hypothetical protein
MSYFNWKENYVGYKRLPWCELCAKLNNPNEPEHIYSNVHDWWFLDDQSMSMCRDILEAPYYESLMDELSTLPAESKFGR